MWGSESWNMAQNIYQNIPTRKTPTPKIKKISHSDPPLLSQNPGSTRGGLFTYLKIEFVVFQIKIWYHDSRKKSVIEYILRQNPRDTESAEKFKIDEFNQISKSCS